MSTLIRSIARFGGLGKSEEFAKLSEIGATLIKSILYVVLGFVLLRYFSIAAISLLVVGAVYVITPKVAKIIPTGHRGLVVRFGVATGKVVNEGLTIRIPFIRDLLLFETRIKNYTYEFACVTKDQKRVIGAMRFSYQIDEDMLQELFAQFGADYQVSMMDAIVSNAFSETISQIDSSKLISTYDGIKGRVAEAFSTYGVNISLPVVDVVTQLQ